MATHVHPSFAWDYRILYHGARANTALAITSSSHALCRAELLCVSSEGKPALRQEAAHKAAPLFR